MEEWCVARYVPDGAHFHEQVETGHVDAGEETVDLAVGGFIEIVVVPETIFFMISIFFFFSSPFEFQYHSRVSGEGGIGKTTYRPKINEQR